MSKDKNISQLKEEKLNRVKEVKKVEEKLETEKLVQDNKIHFKYKDNLYRVRKPNPEEQEEIRNEKTKKYTEYLKDDSYMLKEELIAEYNRRGIDLDDFDKKIKSLSKKEYRLEKELGQISDKDTKNIERLRDRIIELRYKQMELSNRKNELLKENIENLVWQFEKAYTIYIILEVKNKEGEWNRVFSSFEEFNKCEDEGLLIRAIQFVRYLIEDRMEV